MTVSLSEFLYYTSETICRRKLMVELKLTRLTFDTEGRACETIGFKETMELMKNWPLALK